MLLTVVNWLPSGHQKTLQALEHIDPQLVLLATLPQTI